MPVKLLHTSLVALTALASPLSWGHWDAARPDSHAPIGVMADHTHKQGEWMFSYRMMHMEMEGNRNGTNRLSSNEVLAQFMVAPKNMDMDMHMLGAMYAPTDNFTASIMVPYLKNTMDHVTGMGAEFETVGEGLGDISIGGIYKLHESQLTQTSQILHRVIVSLSIGLPTGDDNIRDDTVMPDVKLPYPMQTGSGTYNLMPSITYLGQQANGPYSWGTQGMATLHTGTNDQGYRRGDRLQLTGWLARVVSDNVSLSARLSAQSWDGIEGRDKALNPMMVQTANPSLLSGKRADFGLGLNFIIPGTKHRLAIEASRPVWQDLDGPQLETDMIVTVGWQWAL